MTHIWNVWIQPVEELETFDTFIQTYLPRNVSPLSRNVSCKLGRGGWGSSVTVARAWRGGWCRTG